MTSYRSSDYRRTLVCVDSYDQGVLKGRFYNAYWDTESFDSLTQFLIKMETLMEDIQMPQSYTVTRAFSPMILPPENSPGPNRVTKGSKATFEIQILFRQHTSWQGVVIWLDQQLEQSFRSVLELVVLMDSALRKPEGRDAAAG